MKPRALALPRSLAGDAKIGTLTSLQSSALPTIAANMTFLHDNLNSVYYAFGVSACVIQLVFSNERMKILFEIDSS